VQDFEGRTVLVTGANRGIGLSFVEALMDRGLGRVYAGLRTPENFAALKARFGDAVELVPIDLASPASIDRAIGEARGVDMLIANAGRTLIGPFFDQPEAEIRDVFEVNMFGPLRLMRGLLPELRARRGGIICILSMGALMPALQAEAYSASKAGMMMLAHGVRTATKVDDVRVSLVYPGFVDTPMSKSFQVKKANPRQVADRALDGWLAGATSIFPDVFAEMTRDALLERMPEYLSEPNDLLTGMVSDYLARADAGL
jgi:NAD(P)-dependent dehydrogenase (short-subunit alcohol dehydrogenase family)